MNITTELFILELVSVTIFQLKLVILISVLEQKKAPQVDRHNSSHSIRRDKNKTKETTDPNLNDLEINDNSTKDNLITPTRVDCNNDI